MNKKILCTLLSSITALLAVPAFRASAEETAVNAALLNTEFQTVQDAEFTTTLYLPENSNIAIFDVVLNYDTSCVSLVEAVKCEGSGENVGINTTEEGKIVLSFASLENQTSQMDIVDLTFHVVEDLAGGSYDFITLDTTENNVASSLTNDGTSTDHTITEEFTALNIYQYGDTDLNGTVQSKDVTYLKQHIVKMRDLSEVSKSFSNAYMDFSEDGVTPKLNSRDAMLIQQKVVKMDVNLGDRVTVTFYNADGTVYTKKSIKAGGSVTNIPAVPEITGYIGGQWSSEKEEAAEVSFENVTSDLDVYVVYDGVDENVEIYNKTIEALEFGFTQEGKYIADNFQLPYKNTYGTFNMLSTEEFSGVDIIWKIDSGVLAQSVVIGKDYVVTVPELDYTTWVTFIADIRIDGTSYGTHEFKREIKGIIDIPSPDQFADVLKQIPAELPENYRLPGYISLESQRQNYGVEVVQNVDIKWSIVKNEDGSAGDVRGLDTTNNQIVYLKDENNVTLQADFIFDGNVVYTDRISRTISAKSIEGQVAYAEEYIKSFVPSIISGETYLPTNVSLYDLTLSWYSGSASGKIAVGDNVNLNNVIYKTVDVGEKAGYMEWGKLLVNVERNGDDSFPPIELSFDVQLAGDSTEITTENIPDVNLYKALVAIFDTKYGDDDGILTEEEIYNTETMELLNYKMDLSGKGIENISGIKYLKNYRVLDLSDNDLSGENANLSDLANLNYLEQLSLSNCRISEIPDSVFASKYLIEGVDLSYNKLKNVDFLKLKKSQAFTELKELFLQGNYITDISNLSFVNDKGENASRIPNVSILTLTRDLNYYETTVNENGNTVLKETADYEYDIYSSMDITPIGQMKNLTVLWLANNKITDISPISNCKLLTTLDLSGNCIVANASEDGLAPLSKLQSLVCLMLNDNQITTVKSLQRLIYLQVLSLSDNTIGNLPLTALTDLTYLDLDNNQLATVDVGTYTKLQHLYLENNELIQVQNLNAVPNLQELRLNGNDVDVDTIRSISNLTQLYYLSLSGNTVPDLSFLSGLTGLTHLELADCDLTQTIEVSTVNSTTGESTTETVDNLSYLSTLTNLTILDLSNNTALTDISALKPLTKIGVFYINNVPLESASDVRYMTKLQYLSMQNSDIHDFSFLSTLNSLEFVNLSGHNAAAFDFSYIKNYENIKALFLDSECGSEVVNFDKFVNKVSLQFLSLANLNINSIDNVPDMDSIIYLGLRNTGIRDFNGTFHENDGYLYPITRFTTLKYLDVADNPELFTKNNLETLYNFIGDPNYTRSIILYRDNAPEGYVPGVMDAAIESKRLAEDISFGGEEAIDISAALDAGYQLQETLNGYDVQWNLEENDQYYVNEGKLYFTDTETVDESLKLSLMLNIIELYQQPETSVSFNASIQTVTKPEVVDTVWVRRDETTSTESTLEGWTLDESKTEYGYSEYSDWSSWSTTAVSETDLRDVETKVENGYTDWGAWSSWSTNAVSETDLRDVETQQKPVTTSSNVYYPACSSSYSSLVDALKSVNVDSSYSNRAKIAATNGISNYSGSSSQNVQLLNLLKKGQLLNYVATNTTYVTEYRYRERSTTSTTYYRYRTRTEVPTIYHFYKDVYEDVYEDVVSGVTLVVE